jgi:hypothetical protein
MLITVFRPQGRESLGAAQVPPLSSSELGQRPEGSSPKSNTIQMSNAALALSDLLDLYLQALVCTERMHNSTSRCSRASSISG